LTLIFGMFCWYPRPPCGLSICALVCSIRRHHAFSLAVIFITCNHLRCSRRPDNVRSPDLCLQTNAQYCVDWKVPPARSPTRSRKGMIRRRFRGNAYRQGKWTHHVRGMRICCQACYSSHEAECTTFIIPAPTRNSDETSGKYCIVEERVRAVTETRFLAGRWVSALKSAVSSQEEELTQLTGRGR
jgi:hypothetical protein